MARRSRKVREIRLVGYAHREAEDRLRRAYRRLWQASRQPKEKREKCEDGKESGIIRSRIDGAPRTSGDD